MKQALVNFAKAETALLSQHIIDLQKDKGNLTDKVRELEQQNANLQKAIGWSNESENEKATKITKLELQIGKMKCCYNCDHAQDECYCSIKHSDICDLSCWDKGCAEWKLRR